MLLQRPVTDIRQWLEQAGLSQYQEAFVDNDITLALLPSITADDLRDIGIRSVGHRRLLIQAIAQWQQDSCTLPTPTDIPSSPALVLAQRAPSSSETKPAITSSPGSTTNSQHRLLTVLFCDLVGSTELSGRLDAEDLAALLTAYRVCVTEVIQTHKGFIAQYVGDGVLAYFGYPHILESDCERALRTALDILRAVQRLEPVAGVQLQVRIGMATGMAVVGHLVGAGATTEIGAVGETPNLAARMQALAQPGSVVVAKGTRDAAGDLFEFRSLGAVALKGFAQPVVAWELLSQLHSVSRFHATRGRRRLGTLIGRDVELLFLRDRMERARQGRGQAVLLRGEPGTGKSHLVTRLSSDSYPDQPPAPVLQCSPDFNQVPFYPFAQHLEASAQLGADDSDAERLQKLQAVARHYGLDQVNDAFALAELLGMHSLSSEKMQGFNAKDVRDKVQDVLLRWLHSLMQERKLIVVEDLHWADPSTMEVLALFIAEFPRQQAMLIATSRPTNNKILNEGTHVSVVHLDRLHDADIRTIVTALAAPRVLPQELIDEIVLRAEGVPIFATELARALLVREDSDTPTAMTAIPTTLNDILLSRLDQLEFGGLTVQQAAVLGREFEMSLLVACAKDLLEDSQAAIAELLKAELFVQRSTPNGIMLGFDHMLVRDAVYQRMLRTDRSRLHTKVAHVMEQQFPQSVVLSPHLLAQHYSEAGNHERAAHFWECAGELAANKLAPQEAVAHYTRALESLAEMVHSNVRDERELRVCTAIAGPLIGTRGLGSRKLLKIVNRAYELCNKLPHGAYHVSAQYLKWAVALGSWDLADLQALARGVQVAAENQGHGEGEVASLLAHRAMGFTYMIQGELKSAQNQLESFLALYDAERHGNLINFRFSSNSHLCSVLLALATTCTLRGLPDVANHWRDQALQYAHRSGSHLSICQALIFCGGHVSGLWRRPTDMASYSAQARDYANKHKLPIWLPYADLISALGQLMDRRTGIDAAQCLDKAKTCVDILLSQHSAYLTAWVVLYARACLEHGHYHEGLQALARIDKRIDAGERWMKPEYLHLRAMLQHALQPQTVAALRVELQAANALAIEQGSLIFVDDIQNHLQSLSL